MAKRLKLGVDMDEVIVDFISAFRQEAEKVCFRSLNPDPGAWDFTHGNWGLTTAQLAETWNRITTTGHWFYLNCDALPGVVKNLPWLIDNHEVYFITSRPETAGFTAQKQTQMSLYDLGVQFPTVIVTYSKGLIVDALGLDAFVDDKPENLLDVAAHSPDTKLFVMDRSHNQRFAAAGVERVMNFEDFVAKAEALSNAR
jgi:uncharacterized HAD superfamily protein